MPRPKRKPFRIDKRSAAKLLPTALFFYVLFLSLRLTLYLPASLIMLWLALMLQRKSKFSDRLFPA